MAPKGGNAKKESGRAKKAENEVSVGCERGEIAKVTRPPFSCVWGLGIY